MHQRTVHPARATWQVALAALLVALALPASAVVHPVAVAFDRLSVRPVLVLDHVAELHCLALNVYHEARNESVEGRFAVAAVTINRLRSERFPDTVCEVVWQRGQFSWTRDGKPDNPYNLEAWEEALWIARLVYEYDRPSPVGDAVYYHAAYVRPAWAKTQRPVARVGNHIFYEDPA